MSGNGIFVALHPAGLDGRPKGGPRGLIRVGYEENGRRYLINFIAVKPIVASTPGYSELETGGDGRPGKRFWVGDGLRDGGVGETGNVLGSVERTPAGTVLSLVVHVEPYANGARPVVEISLFKNAPERIRLRTFSGPRGAPMERCILSATMGNQSRCRWLWLKAGCDLRPGPLQRFCGHGFCGKGSVRIGRSPQDERGDVVAAITPDESSRARSGLCRGAVGTTRGSGWPSSGSSGGANTTGRSNATSTGGRVYWAGNVPIPGGLAYENFDFQEDFRPGQEIWFGYTPESPAKSFAFPYDVPLQANRHRKSDQGREGIRTRSG